VASEVGVNKGSSQWRPHILATSSGSHLEGKKSNLHHLCYIGNVKLVLKFPLKVSYPLQFKAIRLAPLARRI